MWTPPRAKGDCRYEGDAGCSYIFGVFKKLHFTLTALMEIRAPSPSQPSGLEGLSGAVASSCEQNRSRNFRLQSSRFRCESAVGILLKFRPNSESAKEPTYGEYGRRSRNRRRNQRNHHRVVARAAQSRKSLPARKKCDRVRSQRQERGAYRLTLRH